MRSIIFEVDEETAGAYDSFCPEVKKQLAVEIAALIRKSVFDERVTKLKRIIEEINNDPSGMSINPDILYDLLRIEE